MTDIFNCIAIEEGLWGLGIYLVFLLLLVGLLLPPGWMLLQIFRRSSHDEKSYLKIQIGEQVVFEGKGRMSAFAVPLLGIVAVALGLYFGWSRFAEYAEWRSVTVETSGSARTLDKIREKMSQDPRNRVTVMVA